MSGIDTPAAALTDRVLMVACGHRPMSFDLKEAHREHCQ